MVNILRFIPFLAGGLLLVNPILLLLYRRLKANLQKLNFWFMLTSTAVWLLLLLLSLIGLDEYIKVGSSGQSQLLAYPVFILDWTSISIALALAGVALFSTLKQTFSPRGSAWITGLGGVSILGIMAGSVYTLLFFWTLLEVFWIAYNALYQPRDRGLILPVLFRLMVPLLLIYTAVYGAGDLSGESFLSFPPNAGIIFITAGSLGIAAWIPFRRRMATRDPGGIAELIARIFPVGVSLMLICRGAALLGAQSINPLVLPVLAGISITMGVLGLLSNSNWVAHRIWSLGILCLISSAALSASAASCLGWGLVFILPFFSLTFPFQGKTRLSTATIIGVFGILPLPFFPAWLGVELIGSGLSGTLFAIGTGLLLLGILRGSILGVRQAPTEEERISVIDILCLMIILLTQIAISVPRQIGDSSFIRHLPSITIWIPAVLILVSVIFLFRDFPTGSLDLEDQIIQSVGVIPELYAGIIKLADGIISLIAGLFEGEGGLIWALLIGFLLITLLAFGGGP